MKDLNDWKEISKKYYRYVIAANVCYEIIVHTWYWDTDILTARASLFIAGDWRGGLPSSGSFFERELLLSEQPLFECLEEAIRDKQKYEDAEKVTYATILRKELN